MRNLKKLSLIKSVLWMFPIKNSIIFGSCSNNDEEHEYNLYVCVSDDNTDWYNVNSRYGNYIIPSAK